ncbi:MAG: iron ABC transporter permease [Clostridiales bacterium]|nr:iron ABC transporter permease [Clostridiales bacterium]
MENKNISDVRREYEQSNRRKNIILLASIVIMLIAGLYFVTLGVADTTFSQVLSAVSAWIGGRLNDGSPENINYKIIVLMRLPRIAMAIVAGVGLSISGVAMQAVTRNPLVSPFTMGISNAAAFGASMCIVFGTGAFFKSELGIICCAFAAAGLCIALVSGISSKAGMGPETVVLTGIALNYFFSALTSAIEFFAEEYKLAAVVQWTFGTLNGTVWSDVFFSGVFVVVCTIIIMSCSLKLNTMASGDDELAESLGLNPKRIRTVMCVASVFMTAAVISFTGVIGFVGLVAPHIARMLVGNDHKYLIPFSAVTGSMLLMAADAIGKTILSPVSIPVGIVVSFLGVPLFINLILRQKKGRMQ